MNNLIQKILTALNPDAKKVNMWISIRVFRAAENRWEDEKIVSTGHFDLKTTTN